MAVGSFGRATVDSAPSVGGNGDLILGPNNATQIGDTWHILGPATAALTAVPSTVAGHSLWNGEPDNGKFCWIHSFGALEIVPDVTQQNALAMFFMMTRGKIAGPTDANLTVGSFSGRRYGGNASSISGATGLTDFGWGPAGSNSNSNTTVAGSNFRNNEVFCEHWRLIVPPSGMFHIAAAKSVATAAQIRYFIRWREVPKA
jgi:hypothetical protein